jgi:hypothetical protein
LSSIYFKINFLIETLIEVIGGDQGRWRGSEKSRDWRFVALGVMSRC